MKPAIPCPHRHESDLTGFAWSNRLAGFAIGVITTAVTLALLHHFMPFR